MDIDPTKPKRAPFTTEKSLTRQKAKVLFAQGLRVPDIAQRIGVETATVHKWKERGAWTALRAELASSLNKAPIVTITQEPRAQPLRTTLNTGFAEFIKTLPAKCPKNPVLARAANAAWRDAATTASMLEGWADGGNVTVNVGALASTENVVPMEDGVTVEAMAEVNTTDIVRSAETPAASACGATGTEGSK